MKKITIRILIITAVLVILGAASSAFYTVAENEYGFIVRFSKVENVVSTPGLHMKTPMIDQVMTLPRTVLLYDIPTSDVLTSDSKAMTVDSYVLWRIIDPMEFYKNLGSISEAQVRLDAGTYNVLKDIIGKMEQAEIISQTDEASRNVLNESVTQQVRTMAAQYGIEVVDVKIKRFDLPLVNEQSVYRRMISDRNQIAEKYRAEGSFDATTLMNDVDKRVNIIISNAQAEAESIIAQGEAEYMRTLAEAYNDEDKKGFFLYLRGLEAMKASMTGGDKTLILDKNSEIAKILMG